jgi:hypothetical protein
LPGIANSPVAVAVSYDDIIQEHSGIFGAELQDFLINYVAFLEGKRMLLRREKLEKTFLERQVRQEQNPRIAQIPRRVKRNAPSLRTPKPPLRKPVRPRSC